MTNNDHYTYRLSWSAEDSEYIATCAEFPSLSWLDKDALSALSGLRDVVSDAVQDMLSNGEKPPEALAERKYSGLLSLRLTPELHRMLTIEAAERRVSLSRHLNSKLALAI